MAARPSVVDDAPAWNLPPAGQLLALLHSTARRALKKRKVSETLMDESPAAQVRRRASRTEILPLGVPQRPVNLGDGWNARLVLALFNAVESFRADAGAAGQLHLRQAELPAGAEDV